MISLSVRIHIFLNKFAFLRLVLLSRFLRNADLAKRASFGTSKALLQKRQLFSVAFIFFYHLKVCCNITFIPCAPKRAFFS